MNKLTKAQVDALVHACARAGMDDEAALLLGEQLLECGLLVPAAVAYGRAETLSDAEAPARFATRVEVDAVMT